MGWVDLFLITALSSMSYFHSVFKRHTHVSTQILESPFKKTSSTQYIAYPSNFADIVQGFYLKGVQFSDIDTVTLYIQDQPIQSFTGEWIEMYHQLRTPKQKRTLLYESEYVMIPFKKYIPLFQDMKIILELFDQNDNVRLFIDYVFLENPPAQENMIIEQVQVTDSPENLNFKRPVKELYISVKDASGSYTSNVASIRFDMNEFTKVDQPSIYFRYVQPLDYHTSVPGYFYTYSFCLDPESEFPTGSINMGRVKHQNLQLTYTDTTPKNVKVYAHSYNVLSPDGKLLFT